MCGTGAIVGNTGGGGGTEVIFGRAAVNLSGWDIGTVGGVAATDGVPEGAPGPAAAGSAGRAGASEDVDGRVAEAAPEGVTGGAAIGDPEEVAEAGIAADLPEPDGPAVGIAADGPEEGIAAPATEGPAAAVPAARPPAVATEDARRSGGMGESSV
jgi:hypothetical protein